MWCMCITPTRWPIWRDPPYSHTTKAPAAVKPAGTCPTSAATPSARSSGVMTAVASSKPSRSGTGAGGARPGNRASGETTEAISRALSATRRAPSGEKSFEAATPIRSSRTTRTRMAVSSLHVLWWIADEAKRVSPPHACMNKTSTPSAPGSSSAAAATRRISSGPMMPGISPAPPPGRPGTGRERPRDRRGRPATAGPCRSSGCPTGSNPRGRRPHRTIPRARS